MRLLLIFLTGLFLGSACKKEHNSNEPVTPLPNAWVGPQQYGWGKCKRDGAAWEGSGSWTYVYSDSSKISLGFQTFDMDTMLIEQMGLFLIPLQEGKHVLHAYSGDFSKTGASYWVGYYDETDASYKIDESRNNYMWIDSYDPVKKTVKGRFQAYFSREESHLFNYPEAVAFEDGEFEVSIHQ